MIPRYCRPAMERLWSEEAKFETWLRIELLACEAWAKAGRIPASALKTIRERARVRVNRILEIEQTTRHDVIAFTTQLAEEIGPDSRYVHLGLTSSDVVDTALSVRLVQAADLLLEGAAAVIRELTRLARRHAWTLMMGRTHGMHAEPLTFGVKCLLWREEFRRQEERLRRARQTVAVGKISGAVGVFAHTGTFIERYVCRKLGLEAAAVSNQVLQRDRHAEFVAALANCAASVEKIATEIRHLQRSEVGEAEEPFGSGQKGSSAMPHKRNPVSCEQLCGLARVVRAAAIPAFENIALWHERDISHSSVERVILPDACLALDYMLANLARILNGLVVKPEAMLRNMNATRGVVYSGRVLLELTRAGLTREAAYAIVQRAAMRALAGGGDFAAELLREPDLPPSVTAESLAVIMDPAQYLSHVPEIFERCGVRCSPPPAAARKKNAAKSGKSKSARPGNGNSPRKARGK